MIVYEASCKTDFQAASYLQVNSCGYENILGFDYAVVRSNGRNDYHLLYVPNGAMELEMAGEMKVLCPGEFAFYKRGEVSLKAYSTRLSEPICFQGTLIFRKKMHCFCSF